MKDKVTQMYASPVAPRQPGRLLLVDLLGTFVGKRSVWAAVVASGAAAAVATAPSTTTSTTRKRPPRSIMVFIWSIDSKTCRYSRVDTSDTRVASRRVAADACRYWEGTAPRRHYAHRPPGRPGGCVNNMISSSASPPAPLQRRAGRLWHAGQRHAPTRQRHRCAKRAVACHDSHGVVASLTPSETTTAPPPSSSVWTWLALSSCTFTNRNAYGVRCVRCVRYACSAESGAYAVVGTLWLTSRARWSRSTFIEFNVEISDRKNSTIPLCFTITALSFWFVLSTRLFYCYTLAYVIQYAYPRALRIMYPYILLEKQCCTISKQEKYRTFFEGAIREIFCHRECTHTLCSRTWWLPCICYWCFVSRQPRLYDYRAYKIG